MLGVSFQPGSQDYGEQNGNGRPSSGSGVQEAIRILSLRLPRVLGAQSSASLPLLTSQGSGGNPRVDSVVNQVMSRFMPGSRPPVPMQPSMASGPSGGGPQFSGGAQAAYAPTQTPWQPQWTPPPGFRPRVVVDRPPTSGTDADLSGAGQPPGMFEPLPNIPLPPPPNITSPIFGKPKQQDYWGGGGGDSPFDSPLMY